MYIVHVYPMSVYIYMYVSGSRPSFSLGWFCLNIFSHILLLGQRSCEFFLFLGIYKVISRCHRMSLCYCMFSVGFRNPELFSLIRYLCGQLSPPTAVSGQVGLMCGISVKPACVCGLYITDI